MPLPQLWTRGHRIVILAGAGVILAYLVVQDWRQPVRVTDPPQAMGSRFNEVADRIDPNTADAPTLAALPMLGEKRAEEIVVYREEFLRSHPGQIAFAESRDLLKLRNFGVSTVASIEPFLIFPRRIATTQAMQQDPDWDAR
jgi:hypothetical protein